MAKPEYSAGKHCKLSADMSITSKGTISHMVVARTPLVTHPRGLYWSFSQQDVLSYN